MPWRRRTSPSSDSRNLARECKIWIAMCWGMARTSDLAWSVKTTRLAIGLASGWRQRRLRHGLPVVGGEADVGEHFFERNRMVVLRPFIGFSNGLTIVFCERLIIDRRQRERTGHGIEHRLEDGLEGGELNDREFVDESVNVGEGVGCHGFLVSQVLYSHREQWDGVWGVV